MTKLSANLLILLGLILGLVAGSTLVLLWINNWSTLQTAKDWQALLAGFMALIGASFTVLAILRQIRIGQDRQDRAARAMLAICASEMMAYCKSTMNSLKKYGDVSETFDTNDTPWIAPELADSVLLLMRDAAADLYDEDGDLVADILASYQIVVARLRSEPSFGVTPTNRRMRRRSWVLERRRDLARLAISTEKLFEPARKGRSLLRGISDADADKFLERSQWTS